MAHETFYNYAALVNYIIVNDIELFANFEEWTKGAMSLACLGEPGRELFHAISALSPNYRESENDYKFSYALHHQPTKEKPITIGTFLQMCKDHGVDIQKFRISKDEAESLPTIPIPIKRPTQRRETPSFIDWSLVEQTTSADSDFVYWLYSIFSQETIRKLIDLYRLGATKNKSVIFWQIDSKGMVRTGKIMKYDKDTGHRLKSWGANNWVHAILKKRGVFKQYCLCQCLFGEHLLSLYPDKNVGIVESEKTAVICSAVYPDLVWLATGGKYGMNPEKLQVLQGRNVIFFPDTDTDGETYKDWCKAAESLTNCRWRVSDLLETHATKAEKIMKIDMGDWLIEYLNDKDTIPKVLTEEEKKLAEMIAKNPAIGLLVDGLNLEVLAYEKMY